MGTVACKQRLTMDEDILQALLKSRDDCIDILIDKSIICIITFLYHFQQSKLFLSELKSAIEPVECVVLPSSAKNYSFVVEDSAEVCSVCLWNSGKVAVQFFAIFFNEGISAKLPMKFNWLLFQTVSGTFHHFLWNLITFVYQS